MATSPLFTVAFDVKSSDDRLGNPEHFSRDVDSRVPPRGPLGRWFHVVLRTPTSTLTVAVRDDSLCMEGFRSSDGTWWELGSGLIPGATNAGFGGDLVGDAGKLASVPVRTQQMMQAVNVLAARTKADVASGAKQQQQQKQKQARDAAALLLLKVREAAWFFTATFDVESGANYGSFIAGIRSRLGNPRHFSHNRPVLPPVEPGVVPPRRWLYVVLRTKRSALTLAVRADNLYLEGFRSSDGTWWELTRGFIPGATYAGFGGSYSNLLGETDAMLNVELGPQQMTDAVDVLAARTKADVASGPKQQQARSMLAALLLMVNEAARFVTVSEFVAGLMHPKAAKKSGTITVQMKEQVNGWKDLSEALLKTDARPPVQFIGDKLTAENARKMGVDTVEKAADAVGILLFAEGPKVDPKVKVDPNVKGESMMTTETALKLFREARQGGTRSSDVASSH